MKTPEYHLHVKTIQEDGTCAVILSVEDKANGIPFSARNFTVAPNELMHIEVRGGEIHFVSLAKSNPNPIPGFIGSLIK